MLHLSCISFTVQKKLHFNGITNITFIQCVWFIIKTVKWNILFNQTYSKQLPWLKMQNPIFFIALHGFSYRHELHPCSMVNTAHFMREPFPPCLICCSVCWFWPPLFRFAIHLIQNSLNQTERPGLVSASFGPSLFK